MLAIYTILYYVAAKKLECPPMTCLRLDDGQCAEIHEEFVRINQQGCGGKLICTAEAIYQLFEETEFEDSKKPVKLNCYGTYEEEQVPIPDKNVNCPIRDAKDNLVQGTHPKECKSDEDCETLNGVKSECKCGISGGKFCQPLIGSDAFIEFWDRCDRKNTLSTKEWKLWEYVVKQYILIVTAPTCGDILYELKLNLDYIENHGYLIFTPLFILLGSFII
jgi:hypothetical protein